MAFTFRRERFERELNAFYSTYPADVSDIMAHMSRVSAEHPEWSSYRRKALIHETAAEQCRVHVFREAPFYFEIEGGRRRDQWGFGGMGMWLLQQPDGQAYQRRCNEWKEIYRPFVNFNGQLDIDLDHHCLGYDPLLELGLNGLIRKAEERLAGPVDDEQRAFLEATILANRSLIRLADRFAESADQLLKDESDPVVRESLGRIADSARRVPAEPPQTFL